MLTIPGKAAATTAWTVDTEIIGITPNNHNNPQDDESLTADDFVPTNNIAPERIMH